VAHSIVPIGESNSAVCTTNPMPAHDNILAGRGDRPRAEGRWRICW
jgi:hypothetical protein